MAVRHLGDYRRTVNAVVSAKCDDEPPTGIDAHQPADVVADHDLVIAGCHQVIPRGAGTAVAGQYRLVGVQPRAVGRVRQCPQDSALSRCRVIQKQQCLVRVHGDDGRVERPRCGVSRLQQNAVGHPPKPVHRCPHGHLVEAGCDGPHVISRSTGHRAPGRRAENRQHAVVVEEDEQVPRRIAQRVGGGARPHRRDQRRDEVVDEVRREALPVQKGFQRLEIVGGVPAQESGSGPVKPGDLGQHQ
jgi:hypothetical protein